jgi:hypothetical protein
MPARSTACLYEGYPYTGARSVRLVIVSEEVNQVLLLVYHHFSVVAHVWLGSVGCDLREILRLKKYHRTAA